MRTLALIGVLALAACSNDPDEIFTYTGQVLAPNRRSPLVHKQVELLRSSDATCNTFEAYKLLFTDPDGGWTQQVYRGELQGAYLMERGGRCLEPKVTFSSGAITQLRLSVFETTSQAPAMFEWDTTVGLLDGGLLYTPIETPDATAALDADAGNLGVGVSHHVVVTAQNATLWIASDVVKNADRDAGSMPKREAMTIPSWLFEDFDATVSMEAREARWVVSESASLVGSRSTAAVVRFFPSSTLEIFGGTAPISRGVSCPPFHDPCPLTDGFLTEVSITPLDGVADLSLPRLAFLTRVVLRQANTVVPPPQIELFDDTGAMVGMPTAAIEYGKFTPAGLPDALRPRSAIVPSDGGIPLQSWLLSGVMPASRVRITFDGGLESAGELSLIE
jgi:hypothetical protein